MNRQQLKKRVGALLSLAVAATFAGHLRADNLEVALWKRAPQLLEHFRNQKYANVGVLKFHVAKSPDGPLTHRAGTLNYNAARRLESALVLANIRRPSKQPVMILRDATKTAAEIPMADHLGSLGRRVLFAPIYKPSWGEMNPLMPDAFISGALTLDTGAAQAAVQLQLFEKSNPKQVYNLLDPFVVDMEADTLVETGHTFRSISLPELEALKKSKKVDAGTLVPIATPAVEGTAQAGAVIAADVLKNAPVELQILYNGQPVDLKFEAGAYHIPPPPPNQRVDMMLVRKDNSTDAKYGVVLMVNGVSTLNMERKPPTQCQRWVFARGAEPGAVAGYYRQTDKGTEVSRFRVVPPSKELRTEYKENLGTISFTIFKEGAAAPRNESLPLKDLVASAEITKRVVQGAADDDEHPEDLPRTLELFRERLVAQSGEPVRSVIVPDAPDRTETLQTMSFVNPGLVMSVNIRYFAAEQ